MNLNELLTKQNVLTQIILVNGEKELPKALKVKIMRIRMAYNKIKKSFDDEVQEFTKELINDEFRELSNNTERTTEEETRYNELTNKINSEYQEFLIQKGQEEVKEIEDVFTMDEYTDILEVNASNDVEINGNKITATNFMEIVYDLFVKEDE